MLTEGIMEIWSFLGHLPTPGSKEVNGENLWPLRDLDSNLVLLVER